MACYVLSQWEFEKLLVAWRADQEEEARFCENLYSPSPAIKAPPTMQSLKFWCKARETLQERGEPIPAEFKPMVWLTPSTLAEDVPRYHLTTLHGETPS